MQKRDERVRAQGRSVRKVRRALLGLATVAIGAGIAFQWASRLESGPARRASGAVTPPSQSTGFQLVSYQPLEGMTCPWMPGGQEAALESWEIASAQYGAGQQTAQSSASSTRTLGGDLRPVRTIEDPHSTFGAIAVDPVNNEVVMSDENRFNLLVYDRTVNPSGVAEPRRKIGGLHTKMEFVCGVAVDPVTREIFTVNNDTLDNLVVFSPDARDDVPPTRELRVDHGAWGVFLDREHDEIAISIEHANKISFYARTAEGKTDALRYIQGPQTGLADPHGVFVDAKNDEVVVANHGAWHLVQAGEVTRVRRDPGEPPRPRASSIPSSSGRFDLPSIRVFSRTASGDAAPLRTIQGPSTRLNLPQGVAVDVERNEILVANDGGNSLLIFPRTAEGDVAPVRTIEGPATGVKNPNGVAVDLVHNEIWVSNWGNHSATVYRRGASGNVAPLRTIRSAPNNAPLPGLGNPGAVAYDPKRQEIVVPN